MTDPEDEAETSSATEDVPDVPAAEIAPVEPAHRSGGETIRQAAELAKRDPLLSIITGTRTDHLTRVLGIPASRAEEVIAGIKSRDEHANRSAMFGTNLGLQDAISRALKTQDIGRSFATKSALQETIEKISAASRYSFTAESELSARLKAISANLQLATGGISASMLAKASTPTFANILLGAQSGAFGVNLGNFPAFSRSQHWAEAIIAARSPNLTAMLGASSIASRDIDVVSGVARRLKEISEAISGPLRTHERFLANLRGYSDSAAKFAMFAGATDVLGPGSRASRSAYAAIMGGFNSAALAPRDFARAPSEMARLYRDLEVDEGLVVATRDETLGLLVESGVIDGEISEVGAVSAIINAGSVRVRIRAHRMRANAFKAVDGFETMLREFIASKLEELAGRDWFKHRAPGDLVAKAKGRRREAMRSGEEKLPLINFLDLGDLISIVGRGDNWSGVFEPVFDRFDDFKVDLGRINSSRRATMHARPIDPVRFTEIVLVIRRLTTAMEMDGRWEEGWDDDV